MPRPHRWTALLAVAAGMAAGCSSGIPDPRAEPVPGLGAGFAAAAGRAAAGSPHAAPVGGAEPLPAPAKPTARPLAASDVGFLGATVSAAVWQRARDTDFRPRSLDEKAARSALLARSPALRAAWRAREAAAHRFPQTLQLRRLEDVIDGFRRRPDARPSEAPAPGVDALQARVLEADIRVEQVRFETRAFALLDVLTQRFHAVRLASARVHILEESLRIARRLVPVIEARYTAMKTGQSDLLHAQMNAERLAESVRAARDGLASARRDLGASLDLPSVDAGHATSLPRAPALAATRRRAARSGLAVREAAARLDRAQAALELGERRGLPDLSGRLSETRGIPQRPPPPSGYAGGSPWLEELRDRAAAMAQALHQARASAPAAAETTHAALSAALRRIRLYRTVLVPKARQALTAAETEYRVGKTSYVALETALGLWLDTRLAEHTSVRDAHVAWARLWTVLGSTGTEGERR